MSKWCIDPGHGGKNYNGACNTSVKEKDINLIVSLEVARLLKENDQDVLLTRKVDKYVGLVQRCNIANYWKANYFVSIHHNAMGGSGKAFGAEVIHSIFGGVGKKLAQKVIAVFKSHGRVLRNKPTFSRRGKVNPNKDYHTVISETDMPSIIIEWGFMDSTDYLTFDTKEELLLEARYIAEALLSFINVTIKDNRAIDNEYYKKEGIIWLAKNKLLTSPEIWLKKIDEPMPVWASMLIMKRIAEKVIK